jgi:hypothetical protein
LSKIVILVNIQSNLLKINKIAKEAPQYFAVKRWENEGFLITLLSNQQQYSSQITKRRVGINGLF